MTHPEESWQLTLQPVGKGAPAIIRLRRALKWLLRCHGLKCVRIAPVEPIDKPKPAEDRAE